MQTVLIVLISILILLVFAMCILIITVNKSKDFELMERRINDNIQGSVKLFRDTLSLNQENIGKIQTSKFREMDIIIKDMYDLNAKVSLMSGSGSTVFGIFGSYSDCNNAYNLLKDKYRYVFNTKAIRREYEG